MARVKLSEPCILDDVRYESGEVVEVADDVASLNIWMAVTEDPLTDVKDRPKASEAAVKEAEKAEKAAAKAAKTEG